jgi:hypothetical protein
VDARTKEPVFKAMLMQHVVLISVDVGQSPIDVARTITGILNPVVHLLDRAGKPKKYSPELEYWGR